MERESRCQTTRFLKEMNRLIQDSGYLEMKEEEYSKMVKHLIIPQMKHFQQWTSTEFCFNCRNKSRMFNFQFCIKQFDSMIANQVKQLDQCPSLMGEVFTFSSKIEFFLKKYHCMQNNL